MAISPASRLETFEELTGTMGFLDTLLLLHVLFGALALLAALVAAISKKGAKLHRRVGSVFFWAMLGVGITAIPVTFFRPNPFLFFIALFSFYMAFAGYRRGKSSFVSSKVDVLASLTMTLVALIMIGYGLHMAFTGLPLGWALVAFGALGLNFGIEDFLLSRKVMPHLKKIQIHLARMLGGTIATITAVLVQQVTPLVDSGISRLALWLGPTIIITPLIFIWVARIEATKKYKLLN